MRGRSIGLTALFGWTMAWTGAGLSFAYRPFESTDAAVADAGAWEIEIGAVNLEHDSGGDRVLVPGVRCNYGFAPRWEAVAEGSLQVLDDSPGGQDVLLTDPRVNLKGILVDGPLQEGSAPVSLGVELGALLPEPHGESGAGFEGALLVSWRLGDFAFHVNAGGGLRRGSLEPLAVWGMIVERPVASGSRVAVEVNGKAAHGESADTSTLLGVIWERGGIAYDAGVRVGLARAAPDVAFTAGLTLRF